MSSKAQFEIRDGLNAASLHAEFADRQRIRIPQFLALPGVERLASELAASPDWRHVIKGADQVFETPAEQLQLMPEEERRRIDEAVYSAARDGFQFRYDTIRVPDGEQERRALDSVLTRFAEFMASARTLEFFRRLTGREDILFADAQATRYRRGDFLTCHDDMVEGKNRTHAYVLSLTPGWRPEWGGLLLFNDPDGGVAEAMGPTFNSLHLFSVGQPHSVSLVAPYAGADRISVTGWLRTVRP